MVSLVLALYIGCFVCFEIVSLCGLASNSWQTCLSLLNARIILWANQTCLIYLFIYFLASCLYWELCTKGLVCFVFYYCCCCCCFNTYFYFYVCNMPFVYGHTQRPDKSVGSSGARITGSWDLPGVGARDQTQVLLTIELSLHPTPRALCIVGNCSAYLCPRPENHFFKPLFSSFFLFFILFLSNKIVFKFLVWVSEVEKVLVFLSAIPGKAWYARVLGIWRHGL